MKMLLADDNDAIRDILKSFAEAEGFEVAEASDGEEALDLFRQWGPDIILLDVMMPKRDGFAVCRDIRQESQVPVIMITAKGEDYDRIMGLEIGADDYVVKPFSAPEVMARVRAVLRRVPPAGAEVAAGSTGRGNLVLREEARLAEVAGKKLSLTRKEFDLLATLLAHPERVYSRERLLDLLWGYDYTGDTRTVDTHIRRLRAKLDKAGARGVAIGTVWGEGYKLEENS